MKKFLTVKLWELINDITSQSKTRSPEFTHGPWGEMNSAQQGCIKLIKSDSEDVDNVTKVFYTFLFFKEFIMCQYW